MTEVQHKAEEHGEGGSIHLPAPTAWPIVLAFGFTLAAMGLVTTYVISLFGLFLVGAACVGWFRQVLPVEQHEHVSIEARPVVIASSRALVERIRLSPEHRGKFPAEVYPIGAGLKGGIAGGIAMIVPAIIYGLIVQHSVWYPINLLGGAGVANWSQVSIAQIDTFHWEWFVIAIAIHIITCLLVGLLYGALLPVLPRHPIVLGGIVAPILWTGFLYSFMGFINPAFDARISWGWFTVSQITFGVVAGIVVSRHATVPTGKHLPLAVRLGIEMPGLILSRPDVGAPRPKKKEKE
ncbi:MAG TPA: hypothetical protein VGS10_14850 [Terracidiphilus sp.]|nr:hypothetical protein [Terracidiphilus sp.]